MRMLDLYAGEFGWAMAFVDRGWDVTAVDLKSRAEVPIGIDYWCMDVRGIGLNTMRNERFDFICASTPCPDFSKYGMPNFYPKPEYPAIGVMHFNFTRELCERSGIPYVMENVRAAQKFVGQAVNHCGPFYLWGTAVPPILPQGITKGRRLGSGGYKSQTDSHSDAEAAAKVARIPPELANCVADYAERICQAASV